MEYTKHLIVETPAEIFKEVKKRAIDKGITLKKWILQAILEKMEREDRAQ